MLCVVMTQKLTAKVCFRNHFSMLSIKYFRQYTFYAKVLRFVFFVVFAMLLHVVPCVMNTERKEKRQVRVPNYVSPAFIAERYCVARSTALQWIKKGWVRAKTISVGPPRKRCPKGVRKYRITREEVKFLDSKGGPGMDTHIDHCERPYLRQKGAAA